MTTDEVARLHLYDQARSALGPAAADTLMTSLPRSVDDLATKSDLVVLEANLRAHLATTMTTSMRSLFFATVAMNATMVGLVFAAVRLG